MKGIRTTFVFGGRFWMGGGMGEFTQKRNEIYTI